MRIIIALTIILGIAFGIYKTVILVTGMKDGKMPGVPDAVHQKHEVEDLANKSSTEPAPSVPDRASEIKLEVVEARIKEFERILEEKDQAHREELREVVEDRDRKELERKEREKGFAMHSFVNRKPPVAEELSALLETDVFVDPNSGVAVAKVDSADQLAKVAAVLASVDVAPVRSSYRIEGVVVTASMSRVEEFSIDWLLKFGFPAPLDLTGSGEFAPGSIRVTSDWFDLAIDRAKTAGRLEILSRPHLILAPGESATVSSGREIPLPAVNVSDGNAQSSIEYRKVALTLEVALQEIGPERLALSVKQINAQIAGTTQIGNDEIPEVASQEWSTQIEPEFGRWYAVGGVATHDTDRIERKGWLFRNRERTAEGRREIGLFVRVVPVGLDIPPSLPTPILRAVPIQGK